MRYQALEDLADIISLQVARKNSSRIEYALSGLRKAIIDLWKRLPTIKEDEKSFSGDVEQSHIDPVIKTISELWAAVLDQLTKVHQRSIVENFSTGDSKFSIFVEDILRLFARRDDLHYALSDGLQYLTRMTYFVSERESQRSRPYSALSMMHVTLGFYVDPIDRPTPKAVQKSIELLFECFKHLISDGSEKQFEAMIEELTNLSFESPYVEARVQEFLSVFATEETNKYENWRSQMVKDFGSSTVPLVPDVLERVRDLEAWKKRVRYLLDPIMDSNIRIPSAIQEALQKMFLDAERALRVHEIWQLMFTVGAYCLMKKRPNLITKIWDVHQPSDASSSWGKSAAFPHDVRSLLRWFFAVPVRERFPDHWEGRHGSESYCRKYFNLLLGKLLLREPTFDFDSMEIPPLGPTRLAGMSFWIKEMRKTASTLLRDDTEDSPIALIGSEGHAVMKKIANGYVTLDKRIQDRIIVEKMNGAVTQMKVVEFANEVVDGFVSHSAIQTMVSIVGERSYLDVAYKSETEENKLETILDKGRFLLDWYISPARDGYDFGRALAEMENQKILTKLSLRATKVSAEEFVAKLNSGKPSSSIFIEPTFLDRLIEEGLILEYSRETNGTFLGHARFKEQMIPVYRSRSTEPKIQAMAIRDSRLGRFKQNGDPKWQMVGRISDGSSNEIQIVSEGIRCKVSSLYNLGDISETLLKKYTKLREQAQLYPKTLRERVSVSFEYKWSYSLAHTDVGFYVQE